MIKLLKMIFLAVPYILINLPRIFYYRINRKRISKVKIYKYTHKFLATLNKTLGIKLIVKGIENIPVTDSYLIVANHQNFLDPLLLIGAIDEGPISFVIKKEMKKTPFVSTFIEMIGGIYMDRGNLRKEIETMRYVRNSLHYDNIAWCIFPEGTRTKNKNKELNSFLPGTFKMAMTEKKIILPITIEGGYNVFNLLKPTISKCYISIMTPISYDDYKDYNTTTLAPLIENKIREEQVALHELVNSK